MSGHSKWSTIKRKKARSTPSAARFSRNSSRKSPSRPGSAGETPTGTPLAHGDPDGERGQHAPGQHHARHRQGTGDLEGVSYEECAYEGYGPNGVAILIAVLTDNRNRTGAEIRHILTKNNGTMAEPNAVAWNFEKKGLFLVSRESVDEETLMELALEAGAEDFESTDDYFEIHTSPEEFESVREALEKSAIPTESAELAMLPKSTVKLEGKEADQMLRLMEALEDNDDVQNVYANFDISEEQMAEASA